MNVRPEVLLVHGAWHGSWAWNTLVPVLAADSWTTRTVDLPSSGTLAGLDADAALVRASLASNPAPTLVVGHSYGGVVVSEGAAGAANVVGVAYICAAMMDIGDAVWTSTEGEQVSPYIVVDEPNRVCRVINADVCLYGDCPPALTADAISRLNPQSLASFLVPQTAAAWRDLPSSYLITEDDRCLVLPAQEAMSARAGLVQRVASSHSPFMSRPEAVRDFIAASAAAC
jgi:pimeloyl-ACP methyl ester carboxylesterase